MGLLSNFRYSSYLLLLGTIIGFGFTKHPTTAHASANYANGVRNSNGIASGSWTFCNYDYVVNDAYQYCSNIGQDVDHPVTIVAGDNATDQKVYNDAGANGLTGNGDPNYYGLYHQGTNVQTTNVYDNSTGYKTTNGCGITAYHFRLYGKVYSPTNYTHYLYDQSWGQFLFMTTHEDVNEHLPNQNPCPNQQTGYEEDAAAYVDNMLDDPNYLDFSRGTSGISYQWKWFNNRQSAADPEGGYNGGSCSGIYLTGYWANAGHGECAQSDGYADYMHFK